MEENFNPYSDHSAIVLTLSETLTRKEFHQALVNHTTIWEGFRNILRNDISLRVAFKMKQLVKSQKKIWDEFKQLLLVTLE